jgi:hypothetical protein
VPPLRFTDNAVSLEVCRLKLKRMVDERNVCPFDDQQERRYRTLCDLEMKFMARARPGAS